MRSFKIPYGKILPDKIVYGRFTIKQAIWLGSIIILLTYLFLFNTSYVSDGLKVGLLIIRLIIAIIYAIFALIMAFKKVDIYDMDEYFILKLKYKIKKNKKIYYEKY